MHAVGPIRLDGFSVVSPGGGSADDASTDPPLEPDKYQPRYVAFRLNFHYFGCFELDLRGHAQVLGAAFSYPRLKSADLVLI